MLPWERDADITFLTANYTAFKKLRSKFSAAGYSLSDDDGSLWCCVDGRQAGGKFRVGTTRWTLELYGQHLMESEMLVASGQRPTKLQFAGQWVTVMRNPGLFARNRYIGTRSTGWTPAITQDGPFTRPVPLLNVPIQVTRDVLTSSLPTAIYSLATTPSVNATLALMSSYQLLPAFRYHCFFHQMKHNSLPY